MMGVCRQLLKQFITFKSITQILLLMNLQILEIPFENILYVQLFLSCIIIQNCPQYVPKFTILKFVYYLFSEGHFI